MSLVSIYTASNFYCMVIAADSLSPTGLPSAADCWLRISVAVASETSVTATTVVTIATAVASAAADSIITAAADASTVNAADATVAAHLAAAAGNNDDDAITTSKQVSVISSTTKISLDERPHDSQPDERCKRGRWQQKQQQLQLCNNQQKRNGTKACLSSHQEVAARRLTWRCRLRNCRGGSKAAMMTTTRR